MEDSGGRMCGRGAVPVSVELCFRAHHASQAAARKMNSYKIKNLHIVLEMFLSVIWHSLSQFFFKL